MSIVEALIAWLLVTAPYWFMIGGAVWLASRYVK